VTQETPGKRRSEKSAVWYTLAGLVLPVMNMAAKYEIRDGHKLPKTGAFILAPNHYTEIDPIVMGIVMWKLNRMPRFLAKASLFKIPILGALMRASGQIPVERSGRGADPLAAARSLAERELGVIIYPEGTLTREPDMWPMRGKTGAVRMALQAGVPVIPAAHWGSQQLMARYGKKVSLFPRKHIVIKIGDPVDLSAYRGKPLDPATLTKATEDVMDAITRLLEDLRGEKAPETRWDPSKHGQAETGRF